MPTRRSFLKTAVTSGLVLASGIPACQGGERDSSFFANRKHPLENIEREDIAVTDVKVTLLSAELPPDEQWFLDWIPERYQAWKTDSILVEVSTDAGIKGIGGCTQYGGPPEIKEYVEEIIKPAVIGKNPFDVEFLTAGVRDRGAMVGWAGVDAAFWDIIGKAKGVPVYKLLCIDGHEPPEEVPVYASAGEMYEGDVWPDNLIAEALEMKKKGFNAYKFRPGTHWSVSPLRSRVG